MSDAIKLFPGTPPSISTYTSSTHSRSRSPYISSRITPRSGGRLSSARGSGKGSGSARRTPRSGELIAAVQPRQRAGYSGGKGSQGAPAACGKLQYSHMYEQELLAR